MFGSHFLDIFFLFIVEIFTVLVWIRFLSYILILFSHLCLKCFLVGSTFLLGYKSWRENVNKKTLYWCLLDDHIFLLKGYGNGKKGKSVNFSCLMSWEIMLHNGKYSGQKCLFIPKWISYFFLDFRSILTATAGVEHQI